VPLLSLREVDHPNPRYDREDGAAAAAVFRRPISTSPCIISFSLSLFSPRLLLLSRLALLLLFDDGKGSERDRSEMGIVDDFVKAANEVVLPPPPPPPPMRRFVFGLFKMDLSWCGGGCRCSWNSGEEKEEAATSEEEEDAAINSTFWPCWLVGDDDDDDKEAWLASPLALPLPSPFDDAIMVGLRLCQWSILPHPMM